MKPKDLADAILTLVPNAEFTFQECDLETLQWHSKGTKPTNEQILAAVENNEALRIQASTAKAAEKAALLARLGITDDEAKLLLS
jgi:type VI protein secretion system component VasA